MSVPAPLIGEEGDFDNILGSWTSNVGELVSKYAVAEPFPHVIIENFWSEDFAKALLSGFPNPRKEKNGWVCYNNPLEKKFANNDFATFPAIVSRAFALLQSDRFVGVMKQITGLDNLESDPYLHGAGMHASPNNGKLDMHLDYSIHPTSGKERRVNLINYISEIWDASWGGSLQLYGHDEHNKMTHLVESVLPKFNRACLFRTSDISYHGFPDPIQCPEEHMRRSLAVYYVSPARPEASHRYKARYYPRPTDENHDGLEHLREIRQTRWITREDIQKFVPGWHEELQW